MSTRTSDQISTERRIAARWRMAGIVALVASLLVFSVFFVLTGRPTWLLFALPFVVFGVIAILQTRRALANGGVRL